MESPIVGTFVMCFSCTAFVTETKARLDNAILFVAIGAATRAIRAKAALLLDTSMFVGRFRSGNPKVQRSNQVVWIEGYAMAYLISPWGKIRSIQLFLRGDGQYYRLLMSSLLVERPISRWMVRLKTILDGIRRF